MVAIIYLGPFLFLLFCCSIDGMQLFKLLHVYDLRTLNWVRFVGGSIIK